MDYYNRGRAEHNLEHYEAAIQDYTTAIIKGYDPVTYAYYYRATAYMDLKDYKAAIRDFDQSIAADPDCAYSCQIDYNDRGVAYSRLGENETAVVNYTSAIQFNPEYALAYNNRAIANNKIGKASQALADWDMALRLRQTETLPRRLGSGEERLSSTITRKGVQVHVSIEGQAGEHLTISVTTPAESGFDPVIMLRAPDGAPLAYNDDGDGETRDARLIGFTIPDDGTYTIVIAGAGGDSTGTFDLTVKKTPQVTVNTSSL